MYTPITLARVSAESYKRSDFETENIEIIKSGQIYAFRGTDEAKDVITDIRFLPWYTKELGYSAAGFVRTARHVYEAVEAHYQRTPHHPITLTGHSLGGAMALLVGAYMVRSHMPLERIVTFGAPRVGKLRILKHIDVEMYKNRRDIVTSQPFWLSHPRRNIRIGGGKGWSPLKDHRMNEYIEALKQE